MTGARFGRSPRGRDMLSIDNQSRKKSRCVRIEEPESPIRERRHIAIVARAESGHAVTRSVFGGPFVSQVSQVQQYRYYE